MKSKDKITTLISRIMGSHCHRTAAAAALDKHDKQPVMLTSVDEDWARVTELVDTWLKDNVTWPSNEACQRYLSCTETEIKLRSVLYQLQLIVVNLNELKQVLEQVDIHCTDELISTDNADIFLAAAVDELRKRLQAAENSSDSYTLGKACTAAFSAESIDELSLKINRRAELQKMSVQSVQVSLSADSSKAQAIVVWKPVERKATNGRLLHS